MMVIRYDRRFLKALQVIAKSDTARAKPVQSAVERFAVDSRHPSLNFEKLKGTELYSIRVTQGDRVILRQVDPDTFELIDVGNHDIYRRYG